MIRVGVLVSDINHGLFYQRLRIPFQQMNKEEFQVQYYSFTDKYAVRDDSIDVWVLAHPSEKDHFIIAEQLKDLDRKLVVDCDDLLDNLSTAHPEYEMIEHTTTTVPRTLELADHCVFSTEYLRLNYAHHNTKATVIPNGYDSFMVRDGYEPIAKNYHTDFTIGWVGGGSHLEDILFSFLPGLIKFMENNPETRFHTKYLCPQVLLDKFGCRVHFDSSYTDPWEYHRYLATVPWDVCLVGLTDHPFNQAKSDLRLVDCAVHQIPLIASPRQSFIEHQEQGRCLLADDDSQEHKSWYAQLCWAQNNDQALKTIGKKASEFIKEHRNDKVLASMWETVLRKVCGYAD